MPPPRVDEERQPSTKRTMQVSDEPVLLLSTVAFLTSRSPFTLAMPPPLPAFATLWLTSVPSTVRPWPPSSAPALTMPPPSPISTLKIPKMYSGITKFSPAAWLLLTEPPRIDAGPLKLATPPPSTHDQLLSI